MFPQRERSVLALRHHQTAEEEKKDWLYIFVGSVSVVNVNFLSPACIQTVCLMCYDSVVFTRSLCACGH